MGLDISFYRFDVDPNNDDDAPEDCRPNESIEINSSKYPDNMNKIGYFRSSYNSAGFNSVIADLLNKDGFYYLFDYNNSNSEEKFYFRPNWETVKSLSIELLTEYTTYVTSHNGIFKVMFEGMNPYISKDVFKNTASNSNDAMKIFSNELTTKHGSSSYSNGRGTFLLGSPLQVHGIIPGYQYGSEGVYIVHKIDIPTSKYYSETIEILIEACDYVLNRPDKDKIWVSWSS